MEDQKRLLSNHKKLWEYIQEINLVSKSMKDIKILFDAYEKFEPIRIYYWGKDKIKKIEIRQNVFIKETKNETIESMLELQIVNEGLQNKVELRIKEVKTAITRLAYELGEV